MTQRDSRLHTGGPFTCGGVGLSLVCAKLLGEKVLEITQRQRRYDVPGIDAVAEATSIIVQR